MTHNRMYNFKIVAASQAKNTHKYKNIKKNILNCNVNIFFNQQWLMTYKWSQPELRKHKDCIAYKMGSHF